MSTLTDLAELANWLASATAPWRYIFSPTYRRRVHEGWRFESRLYVAWDVICGAAGIAFSIAFVYFVVVLVRSFF
jgi:hypothetical protein